MKARFARPTTRLGGRTVAVAAVLGLLLTAAAPGWLTIRVHSGDTLWALARSYHTSVAALVRANRLPGNGNLIYAGQTLVVPGGSARAGGDRDGAGTVWRPYTVRSGDSLFGLAARLHADWRAIARRNHLPASLVVLLGQRLLVPVHGGGESRTDAGTGGGYSTSVQAAAARHRAQLRSTWIPSRATVEADIALAAGRFEVPRSLALAVAWQESGFDQGVVSGADAVGAMQVLPSTATFIGRYVAHRRLDLFDAYDNAVAGVGLLSVLLRLTDERHAVAGYYQGLASVDRIGMLPDTKRYVADVLALQKWFSAN